MKIFGYLGPVSSACLGVTCKTFYALHRAKHGTVRLWANEQGRTSDYVKGGDLLANYLISWVPQLIRKYNYMQGVFVTEEKFQELVKEWYAYEEKFFWRDNFHYEFPEYPEREEDLENYDNYLDALREHGLEFQDWPDPGEYISCCDLWGLSSEDQNRVEA